MQHEFPAAASTIQPSQSDSLRCINILTSVHVQYPYEFRQHAAIALLATCQMSIQITA